MSAVRTSRSPWPSTRAAGPRCSTRPSDRSAGSLRIAPAKCWAASRPHARAQARPRRQGLSRLKTRQSPRDKSRQRRQPDKGPRKCHIAREVSLVNLSAPRARAVAREIVARGPSERETASERGRARGFEGLGAPDPGPLTSLRRAPSSSASSRAGARSSSSLSSASSMAVIVYTPPRARPKWDGRPPSAQRSRRARGGRGLALSITYVEAVRAHRIPPCGVASG